METERRYKISKGEDVDFMYKVGDKVRIIDSDGIENYTGGWTHAMSCFVGKVVTIEKRHLCDGLPMYELEELFGGWDERGLEKVN